MSVCKKIIFLDFDGPLSNLRTLLQTGHNLTFDPVAVAALNHMCCAVQAKIVCTSSRTWRSSKRSFINNTNYFEEAGLYISNLHADWSCRTNDGSRKDHIEDWLQRHTEVTHYTVVDDEQVDLPNLVLVGENNGIMYEHFEMMSRHLDFNLSDAFKEAYVQRVGSVGQLRLELELFDSQYNTAVYKMEIK